MDNQAAKERFGFQFSGNWLTRRRKEHVLREVLERPRDRWCPGCGHEHVDRGTLTVIPLRLYDWDDESRRLTIPSYRCNRCDHEFTREQTRALNNYFQFGPS